MNMPFSAQEFMDVFRKYNEDIYPWHIVLYVMALTAIFLAFKNSLHKNKWIAIILSLLWIWMGVVYHLLYFTVINKAAYLFGIVFIVQGILFFYQGVLKEGLVFQFHPDRYGLTGMIIIFYAFILYPVLGFAAGHIYPASPTFGLPCPTTLFTFGMLLFTQTKVPKMLLIIPVLWSIFGLSAVFIFGMAEDTGLIVAALLTTTLLILRDRRYHVISF